MTCLSSVASVSPPGHFPIGFCHEALCILSNSLRRILSVGPYLSALFLLGFWALPACGSFHQKGMRVGRKSDPRFHKSLIRRYPPLRACQALTSTEDGEV